jgi:CO/xanthine dehydrogenase FAD-binding subunit
VRIGALVRNADLAHDPSFSKRLPAVTEALLTGTSAQLRNAATIGGTSICTSRCSLVPSVTARVWSTNERRFCARLQADLSGGRRALDEGP